MSTGPALEIDEDIAFQQRFWIVQRFAWAVANLLIAATLAGLFARGPLSEITASSSEAGLAVRYERFARQGAEMALDLTVATEAMTAGEVALWLPVELIAPDTLERVVPPPARWIAHPDGMMLRFALAEPARPLQVTLVVTPTRPGWHEGALGIIGRPALRIAQLIYP